MTLRLAPSFTLRPARPFSCSAQLWITGRVPKLRASTPLPPLRRHSVADKVPVTPASQTTPFFAFVFTVHLITWGLPTPVRTMPSLTPDCTVQFSSVMLLDFTITTGQETFCTT